MIKFERKNTEKAQKAQESLEKERQKKSGNYNTEEVLTALEEMFHGKCYLCESNDLKSMQIEHLTPHRDDADLKFDWNNLFLSCSHCNNIKSDKYSPILDCSKDDIDQIIAFRKKGYFGIEEELTFEVVLASDERTKERANNTVILLHDIYYGTTPQKKREAKFIRRNVRKELSMFKEYLREYDEETDDDNKEDLRCIIKEQLNSKSSFTAFKRWIIKDYSEQYPEFLNIW